MDWERDCNGQYVRLHCAGPAVRVTDVPRGGSSSGYGPKQPTCYMVRTIDQRWRRVYCAIYSNSGSCYVMHGSVRTLVEID